MHKYLCACDCVLVSEGTLACSSHKLVHENVQSVGRHVTHKAQTLARSTHANSLANPNHTAPPKVLRGRCEVQRVAGRTPTSQRALRKDPSVSAATSPVQG
eukprot:146610-Pelagomonas_calceolata.AAC.5